MEMVGRIVLLFASSYTIKNEDGTMNQGISVQYYPDGSLNPVVDGDVLGRQVTEESLPFSLLSKIESVPGVYDASLSMTSKRDRNTGRIRPMVKIVGLKYVSPVVDKK